MTKLCVPVYVESPQQTRVAVERALAAGADEIELRIDTLKTTNDVDALLDTLATSASTAPSSAADGRRLFDDGSPLTPANVPLLYTCRAAYEGGQSGLEDASRLKLLEHCRSRRAGRIDIELKALGHPAVSLGNANDVVVSHHDFDGRPDRLYNTVAELTGHGSVSKLAWQARSIRDCVEAFDLMTSRTRPTVAICMGEAGLASRVLAKKFGAPLCYAPVDAKNATAPGQVTIDTLKNLYRYDAQTKNTKVFGVVGKPVGHSKSPLIHNAAFAHLNIDAVYLPFLVDESYEAFKAFVETFATYAPLHLSGLSVTLPHKENALQYLTVKGATIDRLSKRIGAVNTIEIRRNGARISFEGLNTDYAAILDCVCLGLNVTREQLKGVRVAVLGAGGTGRTAVAALAHFGADVVILNRTAHRAESLATEFAGEAGKVEVGTIDALRAAPPRVIINTTSLGLAPKINETPLPDLKGIVTKGTLVFDTIYNPAETRLMREAKAAGATIVGGTEMFVRQAAQQFEAWTGVKAPVDVMRAALDGSVTKT